MTKFIPHQYQLDGRNWLIAHNIAGLFLPPGLGKTAITLDAIRILLDAKLIDKVLIIAPLRVAKLVWPAENKKWGFNFSIGVLHGPDKDIVARQKHDIYVINPDGLNWLKSIELFTGNSMLVCDESTIFKNHDSMRFKLIKSMLPAFRRRVILTGTPAPNGLIQLWPQVFILDKGLRLGKNITTFRNLYYKKGFTMFSWELKYGADGEIFSKVDDIIMHKALSELNMPDKIDNFIEVQLSNMQLYNELKKEMLIDIGGHEITAVNAAALCSKLKQFANGIIYKDGKAPETLHNDKLNALSELVDTLAGRPLLVAYEFLHELKLLKDHFGAPHIGGGVSGKEIVDKWNKGEIPVLLVQPMAAGHGLNLQDGGCCDVCWFSNTYDAELYDQLNARVYRQGVKNNVTIHHIVAKGTIDEHIIKTRSNKIKLQDLLLDSLLK